MRTKNARFNRFAPRVCGVPRCDKDSTPHTNRFSTKSPDCETSQNLSRLENKCFTGHSCCCHKLTSWSSISDSLLSKCFCTAPWLCLLCFLLLSARFLIGYCFVSRDNLQIKRAFVFGVPPTHQDFWSQHVEYLRFSIVEPPTFFRADSVTLNTPHTTENLKRSSLEPR